MRRFFPSTLYGRLLRVLVIIGVIASCLVALAINAIDITGTRGLLIGNVRQCLSLAAEMAAADMKQREPEKLAGIVGQVRGLRIVCLYNQENRMVGRWRAQGIAGDCPAFVPEAGQSETLTFLHIAQPVKANNAYLGMIYAEASLIPLDALLFRAGCIFMALLGVALLVCALAAHYAARHINGLMNAIRQQIECLKDNTSECLLPPASATSETLALFDEIRSLRLHLVTSLLPRETVAHARLWYENIFYNLFSLLRHRIPADSSVLSLLSDCELLLRFNADEPSPEPEAADITRLVDEGLSSARALNPPDRPVHLVVSFKPSAVKVWKVQPGYLRALIRHLLLIALARTHRGLICLRLEIVPHAEAGHLAALAWRLEDSGPPLQPGVLGSRLTAMPYKMISVTEASWLLAVQLARRQGGTVRGENMPGGLLLSGEIPLGYCEDDDEQVSYDDNASARASEHPRLVLMAGDASGEARRLYALLESLGCRVFWAANPIQAIELAPAIPVSAVVFSEFSYSSEGHATVRRILGLIENKLMPAVPVWVVTASQGGAEQKAWISAGVSEILHAPVKQEQIAALCRRLVPFNTRYWSACDMNLLQEYSDTLEARLPGMRAELMAQIQRVRVAIVSLKSFTPEVMHNAHAVKSGALALGYMHLAALMANLEYMLASRQVANTSKNIAVLADCLKEIQLE